MEVALHGGVGVDVGFEVLEVLSFLRQLASECDREGSVAETGLVTKQKQTIHGAQIPIPIHSRASLLTAQNPTTCLASLFNSPAPAPSESARPSLLRPTLHHPLARALAGLDSSNTMDSSRSSLLDDDYDSYPPHTRLPNEQVLELYAELTLQGEYHLLPYEELWKARRPFLESKGYELRPRYSEHWWPSWIGTNINPFFCEDSIDSCVRISFFTIPLSFHRPRRCVPRSATQTQRNLFAKSRVPSPVFRDPCPVSRRTSVVPRSAPSASSSRQKRAT